MTTLQDPPSILAKRKLAGTVPHLPDPVAVVKRLQAEEPRPVEIHIGRECKPAKIDTIINVVCELMHVSIVDLYSSTKHKRVVFARELITVLARQLTTRSYPEIYRSIGLRSHSTLIAAHQRYANDPEARVDGLHITRPKHEWAELARNEVVRRSGAEAPTRKG